LMPDKETLDEYARAVAFLKGLNITEKLVIIAYKRQLLPLLIQCFFILSLQQQIRSLHHSF
jgi:hypothetical protein